MTGRFVQKPYRYLAAPAMLVFTGLVFAQSPDARPEFEVASIKPNVSGNDKVSYSGPPDSAWFTATNVSLKTLIQLAYKLKNSEISSGPGWIDSNRYDIAAKPPERDAGGEQSLLMLRTLLEDRFKLMVHRETREIPVYALLPAKNGPKLQEPKRGTCVAFANGQPPAQPSGQPRPTPCGGFIMGPNLLEGGTISMAQFADALSRFLDRRVIDKTGYTGTFNVRLEFAAETGDVDSSNPSIFTALQEQLGLKLESQKSPAQILVIDHAGKASMNQEN